LPFVERQQDVDGHERHHLGGLLGAYPLANYGSVVFDFSGEQLLLGAG
jgi:hypothetical protein